MLFIVSAKASSFGGLSNIGSTKKNVTVSGFDQNVLINLIICQNSELMAGSQYPQTTRSLRKIGLASHNLKTNLEVINSVQDISRKLRVC